MDAAARGFEDWYQLHHARLITSMVLIAGSLSDAEEAVDEACARALVHWDRVSAMASPAGWAYQVALHVVQRRWRRAALERRLLARQASPEVIAGPTGEVWDLVRRLSRRQRTAIVLRYVGDLTEAEVARSMGTTRGTASSTLADARRTLARYLSDPSLEEVP